MAETRWFGRVGRRKEPDSRRLRVLTAAASRLDLVDRRQARRARALRQGWQIDAWVYRDSIPELRYAVNFLANCASRMRLFPAAYSSDSETDAPVSLADAGAPPGVIACAEQALRDLGNGRLAVAGLMHSLSTNLSVAAEAYLLGQEDPQTGVPRWTIRSIDEIVVYDDAYMLREVPNDPQGILGWEPLDPNLTICSRLWTPHPRFRILADGPVRAMIDDCESLVILRRMIRATGRSRLAGRGMLVIPNELSIVEADEDNRDPESDPFMASLTQAMVEPIADEGVASAVVPIVARGPGEQLQHIRLINFSSEFDAESSKTRAELVGILATGFDLPKEVMDGMADLNHWTAWAVSDDTFRHHVEPHVIGIVDCLTGGYLRPYMIANAPMFGVSPQQVQDWTQRILVWYDPVELVTHPDQLADALQLHDRLAIKDETLRSIAGFGDSDEPDADELMRRLIARQRTWPENLTMGIVHANDPTLEIPAITTPNTVPGIKATGVDLGTPMPAAPAAGAPEPPAGGSVTPPPPARPAEGPPPSPVTASGVTDAQRKRIGRQLTALDVDLRTRLQVAATDALQRQLEKAGGRLRSKVAKDETLRTKIAQTRNEHVAATLGREVVTAAGFSAGDLVGNSWDTLREQFYSWTAAAQQRAIDLACTLGSIDAKSPEVLAARQAMTTNLDAAWALFSRAMTSLAHAALYKPDLNAADVDMDSVVPTGVVRAACSVAGGYGEQDLAIMMTKAGAEVPVIPAGVPVGSVGSGTTITDLIGTAGMAPVSRTWVHGPSADPFEPHLELDGVTFTSWTDPVLANNGDFPSGQAFYVPGDHPGCMCDWTVDYGDTTNPSEAS